jgi:lysophospholipid acyltransferase (LPLAT)-like uncharacterized protein
MRGLQGWKLALAPVGWRLLCATTRLAPAGPPPATPDPCIFACLHRDILPAIMYVRPLRPVLLVSNSPDGDILVRTLGAGNYGFVRGASGENGGRAFVQMRRLVEAGRSAGVAVDGPRGPYGVVQEGVLQLARLTGRPIVPLVARARRAVVLDTWDRTVVPWPFSRVEMGQAPPLHLDRQAGADELAAARQRLSDWFTPGEESS